MTFVTVAAFVVFVVFVVVVLLLSAGVALAQEWPVGRRVAAVVFHVDGRPVADPELLALVDTGIGEPLVLDEVRESIVHLMRLGRYDDVRVHADVDGGEPGAAGLTLRYELRTRRTIRRIEFEGRPGLPSGDLREELARRFGSSPPVGRAGDMAHALETLLGERGFQRATARPRVLSDVPGGPVVVFEIDAGPRTVVRQIEVEAPTDAREVLDALDVRRGDPYEPTTLARRLDELGRRLRSRGFYQARIDVVPRPVSDGRSMDLVVRVVRGPRVQIEFTGDAIPAEQRDELVPIEREGSADQDLLEDSARRIERYFRSLGYRDARASFASRTDRDRLVITFDVRRGPQYRVARVPVTGNQSVSLAELRPSLFLKECEPFIEAYLDGTRRALEDLYRRRGFSDVAVAVGTTPAEDAACGGGAPSGPAARYVEVQIAIEERIRTTVGSITLQGRQSIPEVELRAAIETRSGEPFYGPLIEQDAERLIRAYWNRGYRLATLRDRPQVRFSADRRVADLTFTVDEGPLVRVDHILIVGNARTSAKTIERQLTLRRGDPLGLEALAESQRRLSALGLFRRVTIEELQHGDAARRDLVVTVEEAPATSMGVGGGLEGGTRLRSDAFGRARERFEVAPRGFFEIGRRNLWGKNRSINLFMRGSVRNQDANPASGITGGLQFREYRLLGTYREPDAFGTAVDGLVTGGIERASRSSFDFTRRSFRIELAGRLTRAVRLSGRYGFGRTELFNEQIAEADRLQVDRLFPQVRLSSIALALIRDTRSDALEPSSGALVGLDGEITARALGAELGFAKTFLQGFWFRRLPGRRPSVLAVGARLGLAGGFPRQVEQIDEQGRRQVVVVEDVPASERFFAGGDTTVRGYALDRLGAAATIDARGFPRGGNALVVLNAEIRVPVWRDFGAVGFVDAGNVFARAHDFTLRELRSAIGFGMRYRSPVGPIRVDFGFKLERRDKPAVHISIGHAF